MSQKSSKHIIHKASSSLDASNANSEETVILHKKVKLHKTKKIEGSQPEYQAPMKPSQSNKKWLMLLVLPAWVTVSFFTAKYLITGFVYLLSACGVSLNSFNSSIVNATFAALVYIIMFGVTIGLPWLIQKRRTSKSDLGLTRLPTWTDIFLTPAAFTIYIIMSGLIMLLVKNFVPGINLEQAQDVGFDQLSQRYEYILAFITLVVVAPIAEETLFRGYLYGKLKKYVPFWAAMIVTSILFGAIHGAWNVAIDTFILSLVLCSLREMTGNIWASMLLHMTKNGIAYYFLFINTTFLTTLIK